MKKLVFQIGGPASFAASLLYEGRVERKSVGVIIANSNCRNIVLFKTWLCVDVVYVCVSCARSSFLLSSSLENRVRFVFTAADFSSVDQLTSASTLDGAPPRRGGRRGRGQPRPPVLVLEILLDGAREDEGVDLAVGDALLRQVLADHAAAQVHEREGLGCKGE